MRLDRRPVQTRFRCGSPNAWPRRMPQLAGSFYKRHAVTPHGCSDCLQAHGFRCCFTPLSGCFSPFPHGTGSLSVIGECLALEGGPPSFGPGFTCPALLGDALAQGASVRVRGSHPVPPAFPGRSAPPPLCDCAGGLRPSLGAPRNPRQATSSDFDALPGLGSSAFARRYSRILG